MQLVTLWKVPTLILCHNIDTVIQMKREFLKRTNIKSEHISSLCSKTKDVPWVLVDITTHAWYKKNAKSRAGLYRAIIYDECDYNISYPYARDYDSAMTTALIRSDADIMFGLSGTPFKQESGEAGVTLLFGDLLYMPDQALNWYNMLPNIKRILYQNQTQYLFETWPQLRSAMYNDEIRFNSQINYINENKAKYNLLLFENVKECELYYEKLKSKSKDVDADKQSDIYLLHWQLGTTRYNQEFGGLSECRDNHRWFTIVATADKIWRGVDIPEIDTIFLFFPAKFKGTIVQAVGRALRYSPEKKDVIIHDWCDLPLLGKQARERKKAYLEEYGATVKIDDFKLLQPVDGNKNLHNWNM